MDVTYKITYMVDPGDGIESTTEFKTDTDDMGEALANWFNAGHQHFVTKCEIIGHPNMVE